MEFSKGYLVTYSLPEGIEGDKLLVGKIGEVKGYRGHDVISVLFDEDDYVDVQQASLKLTKIFTK